MAAHKSVEIVSGGGATPSAPAPAPAAPRPAPALPMPRRSTQPPPVYWSALMLPTPLAPQVHHPEMVVGDDVVQDALEKVAALLRLQQELLVEKLEAGDAVAPALTEKLNAVHNVVRSTLLSLETMSAMMGAWPPPPTPPPFVAHVISPLRPPPHPPPRAQGASPSWTPASTCTWCTHWTPQK